MKTKLYNQGLFRLPQTLALTLGLLSASSSLPAQTACPAVEEFATGLLAPSKIIQTPRGNFLVAEGGAQVPNSARISIVDEEGNRRTLLDGLPSGRSSVGEFSGLTGLQLRGRTLFVLGGEGDSTLRGPVQGTEMANPTPASPLFSSILAVQFSAAMEDTTTGVRLTLADHQALKAGRTVIHSDAQGRRMTIQLVADFPDYLPEPRTNFVDNVRHSHPYGLADDGGRYLYIADAGLNLIRKLDLATGTNSILARFVPTLNPRPVGPPFVENVPTSLRWSGDNLLVTLLSGGPAFLPGYSQVQQVDPVSGAITPLITDLSSAIDALPLRIRARDRGFLTLEINLTYPTPGPGRIQYFPAVDDTPVVLADCLTTPTSMVFDQRGDRVVITEIDTGRLVTLDLQSTEVHAGRR